MSDLADKCGYLMYAEIAAGRARLKAVPVLAYTGCCRFCEEVVDEPKRFCNVDCRDDFERVVRRGGGG